MKNEELIDERRGVWVGDFIFGTDNESNLWMSKEDGEGMQLSKETELRLNELLKNFFREEM